jgi:hypothetical protein
MKNLRFQIHLMLFLIGIAIHAVIGQTPAGTINVDGKEVELFYKIKGSSPVVTNPPVIVPDPPINATDLAIKDAKSGDCIGEKKKVTFTPTGGSGSYEIRYGTFPEVWYTVQGYALEMRTDWNWDVFIKDKISKKVLKVSIQVNNCGWPTVFKSQFDNGSVTVPPIIEQENNQVESVPVILPDNQTPTYEGFAEIGKTYEIGDKFKLHASSVETTNMAQHYWVKKDGKIIYELNSTDGWSPSEIYFGNHPIETIIPISDGNYDFYFRNTTNTNKNIIVGVVGTSPGDAYIQYYKGGLAKTMKWQLLKPGESTSFTLYLEDKCKKDSPLGKYSIIFPVYENGQICLNQLLTGKGTYVDAQGVKRDYEAGLGNEFFEFNTERIITVFKKTDQSKNMKVKVTVRGQYDHGSITVLEKNGLDLMPDRVMLTPWNVSYDKIFNNRSDGYEDSPDYKAY